jgi:hypothetical protein
MKLALGVVFIWMGAACLWVASHGTDAATPWQAYQQIIEGMREA